MAYLDIREAELSGAIQAPLFGIRDAAADAVATGFSALEWLVIALAKKDLPSSLSQPGRLASALMRLFGGNGRGPRLANPQLESLRRFAVMAWHGGGTVAPSEVAAFHAAGYTPAQTATLIESIFANRGGRRVGAAG